MGLGRAAGRLKIGRVDDEALLGEGPFVGRAIGNLGKVWDVGHREEGGVGSLERRPRPMEVEGRVIAIAQSSEVEAPSGREGEDVVRDRQASI